MGGFYAIARSEDVLLLDLEAVQCIRSGCYATRSRSYALLDLEAVLFDLRAIGWTRCRCVL